MIFIYCAFHIPYFHIICHIHFCVIDTLFLILVYLSYTFLFHILYFHILYFHILYFHILSSCTLLLVLVTVYYHRIAVLCFSYHVIYYMNFICIYLSYTFLFHIMYCSYTFHVLYFSYTVILYFTSSFYNCLYFHRIAVLCFSYHVIYSIHVISF